MWSVLAELWPYLLSAVNLAAAVVATGHVILRKRDVRGAIGWVGLIWLAPLAGSLAYYCLGINRIRRRGLRLAPALDAFRERLGPELRLREEDLDALAGRYPECRRLARLTGQLTARFLQPGNAVWPLEGGDQAYPPMLDAIAAAQRSLTLCTYILDTDRAGREFIEALGDAHQRGVAVRVLIDDVGARYSRPTALALLRERGVPCASFLPARRPRVIPYANLRNHRKILIADGTIGFTGGMNIRAACRLGWQPRHPTLDLHFRIEGPVVAQLQETFAVDWAFASGEMLEGDLWFPAPRACGGVLARAVSDGPDEDFDKLRLTILGALAVAQRRISIVTPYFLPDTSLVAALAVAALRGVDVRIVLPQRSNIRVVDWGTRALLWQVLEHGGRVWCTPPPFDHTKLFVIDDVWTLLGSTNWDARSLRLNFELNVECYDVDLARALEALVDSKIAAAREVTFAEIEARPLPVKLRDGLARLLSPYL